MNVNWKPITRSSRHVHVPRDQKTVDVETAGGSDGEWFTSISMPANR